MRFDDARALVALRAVAALKAERQPAEAAQPGARFRDFTPVMVPGGKPVMALPGQTPREPVMTLCKQKVSIGYQRGFARAGYGRGTIFKGVSEEFALVSSRILPSLRNQP